MKRSTDRILTTHAGSLPRPPDILEKLAAKQQAAFDEPAMAARLTGAVADIVRKQVELMTGNRVKRVDVIVEGVKMPATRTDNAPAAEAEEDWPELPHTD